MNGKKLQSLFLVTVVLLMISTMTVYSKAEQINEVSGSEVFKMIDESYEAYMEEIRNDPNRQADFDLYDGYSEWFGESAIMTFCLMHRTKAKI